MTYRASTIKRDRRSKDRMNQLDDQIVKALTAEESEREQIERMAEMFEQGE